ncbi:hypothetical protein NDU88_006348 [Pleurodeles waltl]|uniref:Uncharacterized protein n=1 Tax=Pleurodeles waltl TaxID=8319 RepID=A0AAV7MD68_PLEWA|nr:hypothetical protein NDU88_006348 [Pleurodeles waltl]
MKTTSCPVATCYNLATSFTRHRSGHNLCVSVDIEQKRLKDDEGGRNVSTRQKSQGSGKRLAEHESIDEFVARLRELSIKCRFGNMTEELIRDQLIVQCKEKKIQER